MYICKGIIFNLVLPKTRQRYKFKVLALTLCFRIKLEQDL